MTGLGSGDRPRPPHSPPAPMVHINLSRFGLKFRLKRDLTLKTKPTNFTRAIGGHSSMVEPQIVVLDVAGSSPVGHPIPFRITELAPLGTTIQKRLPTPLIPADLPLQISTVHPTSPKFDRQQGTLRRFWLRLHRLQRGSPRCWIDRAAKERSISCTL